MASEPDFESEQTDPDRARVPTGRDDAPDELPWLLRILGTVGQYLVGIPGGLLAALLLVLLLRVLLAEALPKKVFEPILLVTGLAATWGLPVLFIVGLRRWQQRLLARRLEGDKAELSSGGAAGHAVPASTAAFRVHNGGPKPRKPSGSTPAGGASSD